jgi:hypothetical protein
VYFLIITNCRIATAVKIQKHNPPTIDKLDDNCKREKCERRVWGRISGFHYVYLPIAMIAIAAHPKYVVVII